ncbi:hypothetical protein Adt_48178 [Abeliophyllum distichum]|uniref:Putative plant transposon protein domain-containing protein n=1 Tax=Abeliophyllum distichum TaxID=126358 RepID=A0ABD1NSI6_9LAMI
MAPRSKPTTSRKGKEIAEDSNAHKRARPAAPTYELYVSGEAKQQATIFSSWLAIAEREYIYGSGAGIHGKFHLAITDEEEKDAYETYVRGVWVPFSPDVIGHFYGVLEGSDAPAITNWNVVARVIYPIEHPKPWPQSNVVHHGDMSDELHLLHSFTASNITLTTHLTKIYPARMTILYLLATGHHFNFGEHIFNMIMDLASSPKGRSKLIFPGLISALYKRAQDKSTAMLMSADLQPSWRWKMKTTLQSLRMSPLSQKRRSYHRGYDAEVDSTFDQFWTLSRPLYTAIRVNFNAYEMARTNSLLHCAQWASTNAVTIMSYLQCLSISISTTFRLLLQMLLDQLLLRRSLSAD